MFVQNKILIEHHSDYQRNHTEEEGGSGDRRRRSAGHRASRFVVPFVTDGALALAVPALDGTSEKYLALQPRGTVGTQTCNG